MNQPSSAELSPPDLKSPSQFKCFAHSHMTATEYAIWSVCRAMASAQNGIVFFSGPKIAQKFRSMGKNTPYTALASLRKMGWFKKVKDSYSRADGTKTPTHYRVLSHEEWAAEHPNCCSDPSQFGENHPSQLKGMASSPSQLKGLPSQPEGTNLYKQPIQNSNTGDSVLTPSQLEGMALQERFLKRGKRRQSTHAIAPSQGAQPYPEIGTGESSTPQSTPASDLTSKPHLPLPLGIMLRDDKYCYPDGREIDTALAELIIANHRR